MDDERYADLQRSARDHLWMHFTRHSAYDHGDVPVIVRGEGAYVYDAKGNRYLDALSGHRLIPAEGPARLTALVLQALADGINDAAVLARYETAMRPEAKRSKRPAPRSPTCRAAGWSTAFHRIGARDSTRWAALPCTPTTGT
jgi:hypothetical protein